MVRLELSTLGQSRCVRICRTVARGRSAHVPGQRAQLASMLPNSRVLLSPEPANAKVAKHPGSAFGASAPPIKRACSPHRTKRFNKTSRGGARARLAAPFVLAALAAAQQLVAAAASSNALVAKGQRFGPALPPADLRPPGRRLLQSLEDDATVLLRFKDSHGDPTMPS